VVRFVLGDLAGVLCDHRVLERHRASAAHSPAPAGAAQLAFGQAGAEHGVLVELRLEVLEVQREVEDVDVRGPAAIGRRLADGIAATATAGRQDRAAGHADREATALAEEVPSFGQLLGAFLQKIQSHRNSKHDISLAAQASIEAAAIH
jgi:hypothetical protein